MAIKEKAAELKSWDEVNRALQKICECEIAVETLNAEAQAKVNDIKDRYDSLLKPYGTTVKVLQA